MMARKLSILEWSATRLVLAASVLFAAEQAAAEGELQVTTPTNVLQNPFVASQPKPRVVVEEPQTTPHGPVAYQNPFANMSKAPPIDSSLRPGPVSRWQHPVIPHEEPSVIKSAVLAPPAKPKHPSWDQLPPAENLRQRATKQAVSTDPTFFENLSGSEKIIRFNPTPLTQPSSIASAAEDTPDSELNPAPSNPAAFVPPVIATPAEGPSEEPGRISSAFNLGAIDKPASQEDVSPTIVSDCADTPESWLAQAQDAATSAESTDELSAVIVLCDRSIHGSPSAKSLASLRKLSAWAYNRRGEMMADAQHSEEAIHDFQVAISMDANCSLAIHNRAVTLAQHNQFGAALRDFNRVIELNPGLAVAYRNRAELLAALGRMEDAVADYSQAIESLPEDAVLLRARAHAYQRLGDFTHAAADLTRAIQLAPNDPDAFTQRGNLAAEQGKFELAQEDFRRAIANDATWADAYRSLAWLQATCPDARLRNAGQGHDITGHLHLDPAYRKLEDNSDPTRAA